MKPYLTTESVWKLIFLALPLAYGFLYAPYGINETDGGFITGLAWQVLSGKVLYQDIIYVRPPIPIWLRALELHFLPEQWAILGERWIFYLKVALYSCLGAAVLSRGTHRWILATLGFVLSAHCYPATAWHTVDGLLFGVLSIWCWLNFTSRTSALFSGVFLVVAMLCKQSFYPLAIVWMLLIALKTRPLLHRQRIVFAISGLGVSVLLFLLYLNQQSTLTTFLHFTSGSASIDQALEHGFLDYFRIHALLLFVSLTLLLAGWWWHKKEKAAKWAFAIWVLWLTLMLAGYVWALNERQNFTIPFAQSRLLFLLALGFGVAQVVRKQWTLQEAAPLASLLALSWCASVSWGYNLPILFATPWVYVCLLLSTKLHTQAFGSVKHPWLPLLGLIALLAVFRNGYEYVYRNGKRSDMSENLGSIFPSLQGVYSNKQTADLYRNLKVLSAQYGPNITVLPAFPQANFLTKTRPFLPLDWVVKRETGGGIDLLEQAVQNAEAIYLIEKAHSANIASDEEMDLTRKILRNGTLLEETSHFWVVRY